MKQKQKEEKVDLVPLEHRVYIGMAELFSSLSKAKRKQVGAVLVKNKNIIAVGVNGTPSGFSNKCEVNGKTKDEVLHAESNAIAKCAKSISSSEDSVLYTTLSPCFQCAKLIIQAGIKEVYYKEVYTGNSGLKLLHLAKIKTCKI